MDPEVLAERERCRLILMKAITTGGVPARIELVRERILAAERAIAAGTPAEEFTPP